MYISKLALDHFRSWEHCVVDLAPGITIFYGNNGIGKTNIVEAVEFLSTGMSHRTHTAKPLIQAAQSSAHIRANVELDNHTESQYALTLSSRGGHRARVNGGKSQYVRDIIGDIPSVTFAPEDQKLISSEPSVRRQFVDSAAVFLVPGYYDILQQYNHIAKQRVALLKNVAQLRSSVSSQGSPVDFSQIFTSLEIWTDHLVRLGIQITQARSQVINTLAPYFSQIYQRVAGEQHSAQIIYEPSYAEVLEHKENEQIAYENIINHYQRLFEGEVAQSRNLIGPHRDDISFTLNGMDAKDYASNGEMWSLALAVKMALCEALSAHKSTSPLLILDDVFAQLDNSRRAHIIEFAANLPQVFITVAAKNDVPEEFFDATMSDRVHFVDVEALRKYSDALQDVPSVEEFMKHIESADQDA
ncbi:DNA replication/repair protein RecF [Alloscardovia omnicolens]|uniref:DNA replication/repair protein RecF n=1 Tax=Alloscardovia omnicolens TaxID=419015 RepID=UPI003A6B4034